jgi:thioredoxin reductase
VRTNERVDRIVRNGDAFEIATVRGSYRARHVLLSMGKRGTPRRLGVPGEDLAKVAYRLIEAETYQHKNLLVVGGGDSAIEAALALTRSGTNTVTLSYRGETFERARERNQRYLEAAAREGKLRILRNSQIVEIRPDSVTLNCSGAMTDLSNDYIFVLIGGESPEEFLRKTGVEIVEKVLTA